MAVAADALATASCRRATTLAVAWAVTLLVSSLGDIVCLELSGEAPPWMLWAKLGLLAALILLACLWPAIRLLRPYLAILLALAALGWAFSWVQRLPGWIDWQSRHLFAPAAIATQLLEMGFALALIGLLFLIRKRRERFFLVRGDLRPSRADQAVGRQTARPAVAVRADLYPPYPGGPVLDDDPAPGPHHIGMAAVPAPPAADPAACRLQRLQ